MDLVSVQNGDGMRFHLGGAQNTDTAFVRFSGTSIGTLFPSKGEVDFTIKSGYSFAERQALTAPNYRFAFDVFDATRRKSYFATSAANGRLVFSFAIDRSPTSNVRLPAGQEDALFGRDVVARVRITWDGKHATLYVNGVTLYSTMYTPLAGNWNSRSSFVVGAMNDLGLDTTGYYASDDVIADFEIR
jgi:hypothetical protein